jgi:hypothetical protein
MAIDNLDIKKSINDEKKLKRNYLTKGFSQFREELLNHAKNYFPTKINDFSEVSLGGMLLDFAAIVGDSLSFYMDHQYNELDISTAIETENIVKHMKNAGIRAVPASPSLVELIVRVEVDVGTDVDANTNNLLPNPTQLPKILKNVKLSSLNNISFYLLHDIDFSDGDYIIERRTSSTVILKKKGLAVSGNRVTESFSFDNSYRQFPAIPLANPNITMIERVIDLNDNIYYEVEYLSQDTVYKSTQINKNGDKYYEVIPAPYRFIREDNFNTGETSIRFGTSNQNSFMEKSLIQDPTRSALSLYGRDYFPKFSFDPGDLLKTNSLGIAPRNTTVYVTYSYGGGLNHNVPSFNINKIEDTKNIIFNSNVDILRKEFIINSIDVTNEKPAVGGRNAFTFEELKAQIPNAMKMQNRIVNYQDLLGKIYSMPSNFGKVSNVALEDDANNIYSKNLYVLCKSASNNLTYASDALKINLMNYLNEYRLIGDSFNILDAKILNIQIKVNVRMQDVSKISITAEQVEKNVKNNLALYFRDFEINQPIELDSIYNVVLNTYGVGSITTNKTELINQVKGNYSAPLNLRSTYPNGFSYSRDIINIQQQIYKDILYPVKGGIFEIKYPVVDIIANVVT